MLRMFETHRIREVKELDGMWDFKAEGLEKNTVYLSPHVGNSIRIC